MLHERLAAAGGRLVDRREHVLELSLAASTSSPGAARHALADYCGEHGVPAALVEAGVLCLSELVTNAVLHAQSPTMVWAEYEPGQLDLAVLDGATDRPILIPLDDEARTGGRGMAIVAELGGSWGLVTTTLGKIVWVVLRSPLPAEREQGRRVGACRSASGLRQTPTPVTAFVVTAAAHRVGAPAIRLPGERGGIGPGLLQPVGIQHAVPRGVRSEQLRAAACGATISGWLVFADRPFAAAAGATCQRCAQLVEAAAGRPPKRI